MSNPFDNILEGQKKAMDFWSKLSEQMAQPFKAAPADPSKAGQELLQEWYQKQQAFLEEAMKANPQEALQQMPEQMRKYTELQTEYTRKWAEYFQANAKQMGIRLPEADGFGNPVKYFQDGMANWKKWMEGGSNWLSSDLLDKMPFNMRPHYTNYLDSYSTMSKYWAPMQRMIKNGLTDHKLVEQYFSPDAYQKVINQMMGFRPVGNTSEIIDNVNKWFEQYLAYTKTQTEEMASVSDTWREKVSGYMKAGKVPFFELATDFSQQMRDQLAPFNNIAAQGRENEISKLMQDLQFQYIAFVLKSAEMQAMVYEAGQFALPDTLRAFTEQYKDKQEMPDFDTFFQHYVNHLETALTEVLHAGEYSKLQSEVSATGTQMKLNSGRLMELMYADMPFLTHSEGDDIAKETHALRQKVRSLEARLAELEKALLLSGKPMVEKAAPSTGGSKKKLMDKIGTASASDADDLKHIKGVGPKLESMLNELGIYTFRQIAKMGAAEYDMIDELLGAFQGRAKRDNWAKQAKEMSKA